MSTIQVLAEGAAAEGSFPTIITGAIAMGVFILLAFVTWSFRDVANRHSHKNSGKNHH